MSTMTNLSLALNVMVLVPVTVGVATDAAWARHGYGDRTAARGILLAVYGAILLASVVALFHDGLVDVRTLLALQVVYKVVSAFTVGTLQNPVIASNLGIALFHIGTLAANATRSP